MAQHSVFSSNFLFKYFLYNIIFGHIPFLPPVLPCPPPFSTHQISLPLFQKKKEGKKKRLKEKKTKIRQKTRGKWGNTEKLGSSFDVCQLLFLGMRPTLEHG